MKEKQERGLNRRQWLRNSSLAGSLLWAERELSPNLRAAPKQNRDDGIYREIGVRPLINCKGTYTIISGSLTLPSVKRAMDEASQHYVHLDELMEAVGKRLSTLTGADWGIVTAGCSAAETLATCACLAGTDPERIHRLPDLRGMPDEVIIPSYSRNVYDHAVRMLGVRMIEVDSLEELRRAFGPRTAMVYVLACPDDTGPLGIEPIVAEATPFGVPVFVDAAAENLTPEIHLARGADLVAYSGGKALRGPQCAGLLLGREDLCRAAWINSAPHHGFGRSLKVGKEEIMGMLAAVDAWYERDHVAEWAKWESWLEEIAVRVGTLEGIRTETVQPESLSNNAPRLSISWRPEDIRIGGEDLERLLWEGTPRIAVNWGRGTIGSDECSLGIMPWMMQPGDAEVVGRRLRHLLLDPPEIEEALAAPPVDVEGSWTLTLDYLIHPARHQLELVQDGSTVKGMHLGEELQGPVVGRVSGRKIRLSGRQRYEGSGVSFAFQGSISGNSMEGEVDLGEYGSTTWSALRRNSA